MPVDASPYQNRVQPANLLEQLSQLHSAANTLGQIEVGKGMQEAIQPDGSVDRNILAQHLKGTVAGSMQAPAALTALEQLRNAGYATDAQGIRTLVDRAKYIGSAFGPLAGADVTGVKQSQLSKVAGTMLRDASKYGIKVPDVLDTLKQAEGMTDKERADFIKHKVFQAQELSRVLETTLPQTETLDTGPTVERFGTGTKQRPQGFSVDKGLPPQTEVANPDQSKRLLGPGGSGKPSISMRSASPDAPPPVRQAMEGGNVVSRGPVVDPRTGQQLQGGAFEAIRQRGQQPQPAAPAAPPPVQGAPAAVAQPAAAAPAGMKPFQTAFPPGSAAPLEAASTAYNERIKEAGTYQERINPLRSADDLLSKMPKGSTGPGTENINKFRAAMEVMGIRPPGADTMKDFVKLHKYLEQNIATAAPPGTNIPSVMQSIASNPNTSQPKEALQDLVRVGIALTRMRQAGILEFQGAVDRGEMQPQDINRFMAAWSTRQDPRAYISDRLGREGRAKLNKELDTPRERRKFQESYQSAKRAGVIDLE